MIDIPYSIRGFDHCELYVGNAKQTAYYYQSTMGFKPVAYRGLETGIRDKVSYVLNQGHINLVITSPLEKNTEIGKHIDRHGDGIKDVAFTVNDSDKAWKTSLKRGAESAMEPKEIKDENGVPFMGGTYFPKESKHGLPSFKEVLQKVSDAYKGQREKIINQKDLIIKSLDLKKKFGFKSRS